MPKESTKSKKPNKYFTPWSPRAKKILKYVSLGLLVLIIFVTLAFDLLFTHNMQLYAKWAQCGNKPYVTTRGFGVIPYYYIPPSHPETRVLTRGTHMYCTPLEAEKAGYSSWPDSWYMPHRWEAEGREPSEPPKGYTGTLEGTAGDNYVKIMQARQE